MKVASTCCGETAPDKEPKGKGKAAAPATSAATSPGEKQDARMLSSGVVGWSWTDLARQLRFLLLGFVGYAVCVAVFASVCKTGFAALQQHNDLDSVVAGLTARAADELSAASTPSSSMVGGLTSNSNSSSAAIVVRAGDGEVFPYEDLDTRAHLLMNAIAVPLALLFVVVFAIPFLLIACASAEPHIREEDYRFWHESPLYLPTESPFIFNGGDADVVVVGDVGVGVGEEEKQEGQQQQLDDLHEKGASNFNASHSFNNSRQQDIIKAQLQKEHRAIIFLSRFRYMLRLIAFRSLSILIAGCMFFSSGLPLVFGCLLFQVMDGLGAEMVCVRETSLLYLFPLGCANNACAGIVTQDKLVETFGAYAMVGFPYIGASIVFEILLLMVVIPEHRRPKDTYTFSDTVLSLLMGLLSLLVSKIAFVSYVPLCYTFVYEKLNPPTATSSSSSSLFSTTAAPPPSLSESLGFAQPNSVLGFWLALLSADLWYYLVHRWCHVSSWMWTVHAVHHSTEEFNITAGPREGFLYWLTPYFLAVNLPLALFFPPQTALAAVAIVSIWPITLHTVTFPEGGEGRRNRVVYYLSHLVNNPSLHRVHHARNHDRLGKNFSSILAIWDLLFGTWESESVRVEEVLVHEDQEQTTDLVLENKKNKNNAEKVVGRGDIYYGVVPVLRITEGAGVWWGNWQPFHHMMFVQTGKECGFQSAFFAPWAHWTPGPEAKCPKLGSRLNPDDKVALATEIQQVSPPPGAPAPAGGGRQHSLEGSRAAWTNVATRTGGNSPTALRAPLLEAAVEGEEQDLQTSNLSALAAVVEQVLTRSSLFAGSARAARSFLAWVVVLYVALHTALALAVGIWLLMSDWDSLVLPSESTAFYEPVFNVGQVGKDSSYDEMSTENLLDKNRKMSGIPLSSVPVSCVLFLLVFYHCECISLVLRLVVKDKYSDKSKAAKASRPSLGLVLCSELVRALSLLLTASVFYPELAVDTLARGALYWALVHVGVALAAFQNKHQD
eukprot:g13785.t1